MPATRVSKLTEEERKFKRYIYNQTYYKKHRMKILEKYRDNFVSKKIKKSSFVSYF